MMINEANFFMEIPFVDSPIAFPTDRTPAWMVLWQIFFEK
jgi:hypothetical protein